MKRFLLVVGLVIGIPLAGMLFTAADILIHGAQTDRRPADVAIVLGAAVYDDTPTPVFRERLRHGVELYRAGQVRYLLMTGGTGPGDSLAEGEVGREYALAEGVPLEAIITEMHSTTTEENLAFSLPLLREKGIERVLLVTDPLHMRRSLRLAGDLGLDAHPSPTPTSRYRSLNTQIPMLVREVYFNLAYLVTGNRSRPRA